MTIKITLKDPDAVYEAVQESLEEETFGLTDEDEIEAVRAKRAESYRELAGEWFQYGEYCTLELDTDKKTLIVVPLRQAEEYSA